MELKRPLEATDGHVSPEQLVDPVRPGEAPEEAWNDLWSSVEFIRLVLELYEHDAPEMRSQTWELLPLMERMQLPGFMEQMRLSSKDACLTGMGGFCFEGPGYFWRKPVPRWAHIQVKKVMEDGHEQRFSDEITIALLESVATVVNEDLWGGGPLTPEGKVAAENTARRIIEISSNSRQEAPHAHEQAEKLRTEFVLGKHTEVTQAERENPIGHWVLSDNTVDVVWFTKHRAMTRRAAFLVRICDLIRLQRCHHWVISYIPTDDNKVADILSRSYKWVDGRWVDDPKVLNGGVLRRA